MPSQAAIDRRQDTIFGVLLLAAATVLWLLVPQGVWPARPSWLPDALAVAVLVLEVGLWRAYEWARWGAALVAGLSSAVFALMFMATLLRPELRVQTGAAGLAMVLFDAVFSGAATLYFLRPSTRRLFAEVRKDRARARGMPAR